jgi:O-antigen ligase
MNRYTSLAVFLYSAISLIVPSGFSVGAGMLVLGCLVLLKKRDVPLSGEDKLVMAVFAFYFLVAVAMNLLHGEIIKEYDQPLRFLLAIPAVLVLRAYPPSPAMFWSGLVVGGILAGLFTGWQNLILVSDPARLLVKDSAIQANSGMNSRIITTASTVGRPISSTRPIS